jgi:hypothetical protein
MRAASNFAAAWVFQVPLLWGQFDLLTPHEAARIVQQLPQVLEASKADCPKVTSITLPDPQIPAAFTVEVRGGCDPSKGPLNDRYVVDRLTGAVTTWGENPSRLGGRASEALALELVRDAKSRLLSPADSRCLALEAAKGLPGWDGPAGLTTIGQVGQPPFSPETFFWLRHVSAGNPPAELRVFLYVDPRTGHVLNTGSAAEAISAGVGELLAKLIASKSQPLLSDQDALSIALKVPSIAAVSQRKGCLLVVNYGFGLAEEQQVGPSCDGEQVKGGVVVNLRDGLVSDADTGGAVDSPTARLVAAELVSALRTARLRLKDEVDATCRGLEVDRKSAAH